MAAGTVGYLLGTFPSADLAARGAGSRVDLRQEGSGNAGAANASALLGPGWGAAVLGGDMGKGALACWIGGRLAGDNGAHLAGTAAVLGHCYPLWSGFKGGGKGVATSAGQRLATFPAYFPIDAAVAYGTARWANRASAAVRVASAAWVASGLVWWRLGWPNLWGPAPGPGLAVAAAGTSGLILWRFHQSRERAGRGWKMGPGGGSA